MSGGLYVCGLRYLAIFCAVSRFWGPFYCGFAVSGKLLFVRFAVSGVFICDFAVSIQFFCGFAVLADFLAVFGRFFFAVLRFQQPL